MSFGRYKRSDLFLVRIWSEDRGVEDASDGALGGEEVITKLRWHGRVQRTVDGEAHQFDSWQGLVDLLLAMLSNNKGR